MKILITFGGTREYIDAVRFITNISTGGTGRAIAEYLSGRKHEVVCLCAEGLSPPVKGITAVEFSGFRDLDLKMRALLKKQTFGAVIHLAAVSDYSVDSIKLGSKRLAPGRNRKINSKAAEMTVLLKKNFKILDRIKTYALENKKPYRPLLVAFKLTASASKAEALKAIRALGSADFVVHNDLREMGKRHIFHIYGYGVKLCDCASPEGLAKVLNAIIDLRISNRISGSLDLR